MKEEHLRIDKPPLGLSPKIFHDENRLFEVRQAITRYYDAGLKIPVDWINEYNNLIDLLKKNQLYFYGEYLSHEKYIKDESQSSVVRFNGDHYELRIKGEFINILPTNNSVWKKLDINNSNMKNKSFLNLDTGKFRIGSKNDDIYITDSGNGGITFHATNEKGRNAIKEYYDNYNKRLKLINQLNK